MVNNPFRGKPISKAEQNIEEWGKVKFKPNKFGSGGKNHFQNRQRGDGNKSFKRKFDKGNSKDSYKFNQVAKDAKPESATPWSKYKDEIVFKQREDEQAALQANMDSEEAKQALKQREINYRKLLIEQKKQEPTKWENFADEDDADTSKKKEAKVIAKNKKAKSNKNIQTLDSKSKKHFKHNNSNGKKKELIPQELLNNFDSKKLSYEQNDKLRQIITKTSILAYGSSLKQDVENMKRKKSKKQIF